jgi:spore coat polysaccharide biosynthesis protein SpsF
VFSLGRFNALSKANDIEAIAKNTQGDSALYPGRSMLTLRPAGPEDEARLLSWRNAPSVRAASFSQDEISVEQHHQWFARKLRDPECALLIVEEVDRPVGQIRLDRIAPDLAELSIALATEARGRGIGREALVLAASQAPRLLGVTNIKALVKSDNEASLRAFRAAGFRVVAESEGAVELRRPACA